MSDISVKELIEGLRERGQSQEMFGFDGMLDEGDPLLLKSADVLEQQAGELGRFQMAFAELKCDCEDSQLEIDRLKAENAALRSAAQAVIDRWDTPLWKDVPATATYINRLRAAMEEKK